MTRRGKIVGGALVLGLLAAGGIIATHGEDGTPTADTAHHAVHHRQAGIPNTVAPPTDAPNTPLVPPSSHAPRPTQPTPTPSPTSAPATSPETTPAPNPPAVTDPNVLFILTDDLSPNLMKYMPITKRLLTDQGVSMTNYYVTQGLCCPSRSEIFTGKVPHNTGIVSNGGKDGGYGLYHQQAEKSTIATWAQQAGFGAALFGKYINDFPTVPHRPDKSVPLNYVPPGWSAFGVPVAGGPYGEWNYKLDINGAVDSKFRTQDNPQNYLTTTIQNLTNQYLTQNKGKSSFVESATYAPHSPFIAAPQDIGTFPHIKYPETPASLEKDMSDKPPFERHGSINTGGVKPPRYFNKVFEKRVESVQAVDRMVGSEVRTLRKLGELGNTYIVFSSDNGLVVGEHNLELGKNNPYEPVVHLPMIIRGPGIAPGTTNNSMMTNADLAPTFANMLGFTPPAGLDGMSMLRAMQGKRQHQRQYVLLERGTTEYGAGSDKLVIEPADTKSTVGKSPTVPYEGVVSRDGYKLIEYSDKQKYIEFYDLNTDPYELNSLAFSQAAIKGLSLPVRTEFAKLDGAIKSLRQCVGAACIR